jgi:DNA polymerase-4
VAQASIDEAYLNLTPLLESSGKTALQVCEEIREAVKTEVGLSVSCGVGPNKMLAKVGLFFLS